MVSREKIRFDALVACMLASLISALGKKSDTEKETKCTCTARGPYHLSWCDTSSTWKNWIPKIDANGDGWGVAVMFWRAARDDMACEITALCRHLSNSQISREDVQQLRAWILHVQLMLEMGGENIAPMFQRSMLNVCTLALTTCDSKIATAEVPDDEVHLHAKNDAALLMALSLV